MQCFPVFVQMVFVHTKIPFSAGVYSKGSYVGKLQSSFADRIVSNLLKFLVLCRKVYGIFHLSVYSEMILTYCRIDFDLEQRGLHASFS